MATMTANNYQLVGYLYLIAIAHFIITIIIIIRIQRLEHIKKRKTNVTRKPRKAKLKQTEFEFNNQQNQQK